MSKMFNSNLRRLVEEYSQIDDFVGDSQPYRDFTRLSIGPEGAIGVDTEAPTEADTVQAAREAVRMLKKRGYRANDQMKAAEKAATSEFERHPEPNYLEGGDAVDQFMVDYITHMKGPKGQ